MSARTKHAEAMAHEIADVLRHAPQGTGRVQVRWDRAGNTWGVRVRVAGHRWDLLIPAPGALYPLWENGRWVGGMHLSTDATGSEVATRLLDRIAELCQAS